MKKNSEYMNWILKVLFFLACCYISLTFTIEVAKNKDRKIQKFKSYYNLLCRWKTVDADSLERYFLNQGICKIAIYGVGKMAELFYNQMKTSGIKMEYFIDRCAYVSSYMNLPLYEPNELLPDVEAIIVTPYLEMDIIKKNCSVNNKNMKYISLEEVINEAEKL